MKPADQILADTQELEGEITKLIRAFEERTGVYVSRVELVDFVQGEVRQFGKDLTLRLTVQLPPQLRPTQSLDAKTYYGVRPNGLLKT